MLPAPQCAHRPGKPFSVTIAGDSTVSREQALQATTGTAERVVAK